MIEVVDVNIFNESIPDIEILAFSGNRFNNYSYFKIGNDIYKCNCVDYQLIKNIDSEIIADKLSIENSNIEFSTCHFDHFISFATSQVKNKYVFKEKRSSFFPIVNELSYLLNSKKENWFLLGPNNIKSNLSHVEINTKITDKIEISLKFMYSNSLEYSKKYILSID